MNNQLFPLIFAFSATLFFGIQPATAQDFEAAEFNDDADALTVRPMEAADDDPQQRIFRFGAKLGGTLSTVASDNNDLADYSENKFGYGVGAQALINVSQYFGFQPELMYVTKGYGANLEARDVTDVDEPDVEVLEETTSLSYLHLPLLTRLQYPLANGAIIPKLVIGPYVSYYLDGEIERNDNSQAIDDSDITTLDAGLSAGIGADFNVGPILLTSDLRYERGFIGLDSTEELDEDVNTFNSSFQFLVGAMF